MTNFAACAGTSSLTVILSRVATRLSETACEDSDDGDTVTVAVAQKVSDGFTQVIV